MIEEDQSHLLDQVLVSDLLERPLLCLRLSIWHSGFSRHSMMTRNSRNRKRKASQGNLQRLRIS